MPPRVIPYTVWRMDDESGIKAVKRIPCVVYAPKYDSKLREEYEVEVTPEGKFRVFATKVSKRNVHEFVGEYKSYRDARDSMFTKFFDDFNRPSEYSIRYGGHSPLEKIWDYSPKGRECKASISIVEGSKEVKVVKYTPKLVTVQVAQPPPFIMTVTTIYPKYFEKARERHYRGLERMRGLRRKGGIRRKFR